MRREGCEKGERGTEGEKGYNGSMPSFFPFSGRAEAFLEGGGATENELEGPFGAQHQKNAGLFVRAWMHGMSAAPAVAQLTDLMWGGGGVPQHRLCRTAFSCGNLMMSSSHGLFGALLELSRVSVHFVVINGLFTPPYP